MRLSTLAIIIIRSTRVKITRPVIRVIRSVGWGGQTVRIQIVILIDLGAFHKVSVLTKDQDLQNALHKDLSSGLQVLQTNGARGTQKIAVVRL